MGEKKQKDLEKKVEKLNKKLEELKESNEELENNWKRALADYKNFKKRTEKERVETIKFANEELLRDLVPVLNNFNMLVDHVDDPGLKITVNNFRDVLKQAGVEEIDILNKDFDSNLAEAVEVVEGEENKVLEVVERGYIYNGKVLKPARVKVGKSR